MRGWGTGAGSGKTQRERKWGTIGERSGVAKLNFTSTKRPNLAVVEKWRVAGNTRPELIKKRCDAGRRRIS